MKKLLATIAITLAATLAVGCSGSSGCGCAGETILQFSAPKNTMETCTYEVSLNTSFVDGDYDLKASSDLTAVSGIYDYEGEYVTTVNTNYSTATYSSLKGTTGYERLPDLISNYSRALVHITSNLTIKLTCEIDGTEQVFNDFITAESFYYDDSSSYSPIYSKVNYENTLLSFNSNNSTLSAIRYNFFATAAYSAGGSYSIFVEDNSEDIVKDENSKFTLYEVPNSQASYTYTSGAVIDNAELLFVLRYYSSLSSTATTLPIITHSFKEKKDLSVTQYATGNATIQLDAQADESIVPVKKVSFVLSNGDASGRTQLLFIQNADSIDGALTNGSYVVKYYEPLSFDGLNSYGCLEYSLTSVVLG